jgi:hypothetical protein
VNVPQVGLLMRFVSGWRSEFQQLGRKALPKKTVDDGGAAAFPRPQLALPAARFAMRNAFDREALPAPVYYYTEIERLRLEGRGTWRSTLCCFHHESRPSLRVNVDTGAFRCMACGANGGDVLAFYRLRYGAGFIEAAKGLGAWVAL